ncbi:MAG: serine/threonine-protein kinase [Candidatus Syntrophosphaera sp.]
MNTSSGENAFTILETIHRSGHFCVYKAKNYTKGTLVNIKTPEQRWKSDYSLCRQLRAEAETGLSLKHPSIRETLGLFEEDNTLYLVCEYLDGNPLENIIHFSSEKLDKETILNWILQILDALQYAHDQDILHLNVNTSSIIITTDNKVKLFGFGKDPDVWKTADADKTELHPVLFIAPEVFLGEKTGKHSDVYSVGILAYLLLCGQLPWSLDHRLTPSQQKNQTLQRPLINPDLLGKHIPHWLFSILNKALMLDPVKRFQSATAMAEAISSQSSLPYESCLSRSIGQGIPQNVKPEGKPGTREQIEISEPNQQLREQTSKPSGKDGLIKDVPLESRSETQSLTNQDESTRDESQAGSGKESPKHKVSARTSEHMGPEIQIQGPKRGEGGDISHMQRIFTIFAIITLLILAYIIVKYVVIKEEPAFAETDSLHACSAVS